VEAENLQIRSDLMIRLGKSVDARGFTQAQAASLFAVTQPRISDLVRGKIDSASTRSLRREVIRRPTPLPVRCVLAASFHGPDHGAPGPS
jgi:predicted XRE-type DNA-binding protein